MECDPCGTVIILRAKIERRGVGVTKRDDTRSTANIDNLRDLQRNHTDAFELRPIELNAYRSDIKDATIIRVVNRLQEIVVHTEIGDSQSRKREQHGSVGGRAEEQRRITRTLNVLVARDEPELIFVFDNEASASTVCENDLRNGKLRRCPIAAGRGWRLQFSQQEQATDHHNRK